MIEACSSLIINVLYPLARPNLLLLSSRSNAVESTTYFATGFMSGISIYNIQNKMSCRGEVAVLRYTHRATVCKEKKSTCRYPLYLAGNHV